MRYYERNSLKPMKETPVTVKSQRCTDHDVRSSSEFVHERNVTQIKNCHSLYMDIFGCFTSHYSEYKPYTVNLKPRDDVFIEFLYKNDFESLDSNSKLIIADYRSFLSQRSSIVSNLLDEHEVDKFFDQFIDRSNFQGDVATHREMLRIKDMVVNDIFALHQNLKETAKYAHNKYRSVLFKIDEFLKRVMMPTISISFPNATLESRDERVVISGPAHFSEPVPDGHTPLLEPHEDFGHIIPDSRSQSALDANSISGLIAEIQQMGELDALILRRRLELSEGLVESFRSSTIMRGIYHLSTIVYKCHAQKQYFLCHRKTARSPYMESVYREFLVSHIALLSRKTGFCDIAGLYRILREMFDELTGVDFYKILITYRDNYSYMEDLDKYFRALKEKYQDSFTSDHLMKERKILSLYEGSREEFLDDSALKRILDCDVNQKTIENMNYEFSASIGFYYHEVFRAFYLIMRAFCRQISAEYSSCTERDESICPTQAANEGFTPIIMISDQIADILRQTETTSSLFFPKVLETTDNFLVALTQNYNGEASEQRKYVASQSMAEKIFMCSLGVDMFFKICSNIVSLHNPEKTPIRENQAIVTNLITYVSDSLRKDLDELKDYIQLYLWGPRNWGFYNEHLPFLRKTEENLLRALCSYEKHAEALTMHNFRSLGECMDSLTSQIRNIFKTYFFNETLGDSRSDIDRADFLNKYGDRRAHRSGFTSTIKNSSSACEYFDKPSLEYGRFLDKILSSYYGLARNIEDEEFDSDLLTANRDSRPVDSQVAEETSIPRYCNAFVRDLSILDFTREVDDYNKKQDLICEDAEQSSHPQYISQPHIKIFELPGFTEYSEEILSQKMSCKRWHQIHVFNDHEPNVNNDSDDENDESGDGSDENLLDSQEELIDPDHNTQ